VATFPDDKWIHQNRNVATSPAIVSLGFDETGGRAFFLALCDVLQEIEREYDGYYSKSR
jgi:hypothetical protein